jgi:hypothetical protein
MAKAYYGSIVTDIIGSIGGLTFQTSNQSKIIRQRPMGINAFTELQISMQSQFSQAVVYWDALSSANKALWNNFASAHPKIDYYGNSKTISGFNWYVSLYITRAIMGVSPPSAPPTYGAVAAPPVPTSVFQSAYQSFDITFSPAYAHPNDNIFCFASFLQHTMNTSDHGGLAYFRRIDPGTTTLKALWGPYTDYFYSSPDLVCSDNFQGGLRLMLVAVNNSTYLSSVGSQVWCPHLPS